MVGAACISARGRPDPACGRVLPVAVSDRTAVRPRALEARAANGVGHGAVGWLWA
jgi:hypothetical protein